MEDIYFYNYEFELLDIEANFFSVNWQLQFNAVGQFEAHFPLDAEIVQIAREEDFLIAVQGEKAAVITGKTAEEDFALFGRSCNWFLTQKVVSELSAEGKTVGELVCELVGAAFADVENFVCESAEELTEAASTEKEGCFLLSEIVQECLESVGAGHEMLFDAKNKRWIFRVVSGQEREWLISEDNRNLSGGELSEDVLDERNVGWYQTEEPAVWSAIGATDKKGFYRRECVLKATTEENAERELSLKKKKTSLTAEVHKLLYGKDYYLGDVVRVQEKKGKWLCVGKQKITGVHLWYESGEHGEQPIMEGFDVI